jgi:hypothetical protein
MSSTPTAGIGIHVAKETSLPGTEKWSNMADSLSIEEDFLVDTNKELVAEILHTLRQKAAALDDDKWLFEDKLPNLQF